MLYDIRGNVRCIFLSRKKPPHFVVCSCLFSMFLFFRKFVDFVYLPQTLPSWHFCFFSWCPFHWFLPEFCCPVPFTNFGLFVVLFSWGVGLDYLVMIFLQTDAYHQCTIRIAFMYSAHFGILSPFLFLLKHSLISVLISWPIGCVGMCFIHIFVDFQVFLLLLIFNLMLMWLKMTVDTRLWLHMSWRAWCVSWRCSRKGARLSPYITPES